MNGNACQFLEFPKEMILTHVGHLRQIIHRDPLPDMCIDVGRDLSYQRMPVEFFLGKQVLFLPAQYIQIDKEHGQQSLVQQFFHTGVFALRHISHGQLQQIPLKHLLIVDREVISTGLLPGKALSQVRLPIGQGGKHLGRHPEDQTSGGIMLSLLILILVHHISIDQQKVPFVHGKASVLHQRGILPLQNIDDLIEIVVVEADGTQRCPPLLIDFHILIHHILAFICGLTLSDLTLNSQGNPTSLSFFHCPFLRGKVFFSPSECVSLYFTAIFALYQAINVLYLAKMMMYNAISEAKH